MVPDQEEAAYDKPTSNAYISVTVPEEDIGFWGNHKRRLCKCCTQVKENALIIGLLLAVVMGCALGFGVRSTGYVMTKREIMYLMFPGEMLMRMLRMLILPLVMSSLISGIANLDATTCGRMGLRTIAYFATTTMLAVILGIIMAMSIKPGGGTMPGELQRHGKAAKVNSVDTFLDLIRYVRFCCNRSVIYF